MGEASFAVCVLLHNSELTFLKEIIEYYYNVD